MTKELTKKESTEVATVDLSAWGEVETSSRDMQLPKILVTQGLSQLAIEGLAKIGDLMNSMTREKVGDTKQAFKFLPFHCERVFYVSKFVGGAWKFHTITPVTPSNINTEYETIIDGVKYKSEFTQNFYCMTEEMSLPIVIAFKGQSSRGGKNLFTQMFMANRALGLAPCDKWFDLTVSVEKNDKGSFAVINPIPAAKATSEQQENCLTWLKTIRSSKVQVVDEEVRLADSEEFTRF